MVVLFRTDGVHEGAAETVSGNVSVDGDGRNNSRCIRQDLSVRGLAVKELGEAFIKGDDRCKQCPQFLPCQLSHEVGSVERRCLPTLFRRQVLEYGDNN